MARGWLFALITLHACGGSSMGDGGDAPIAALTLEPSPTAVESSGTTAEALENPYDIIVDLSGNVFIHDRTPERIVMFDSAGRYLRAFGREGEGPGEYSNPQMAVGPAGLLIHDAPLGRLTMFDSLGRLLWTRQGPCCRLFAPRIDRRGQLYAAEGAVMFGGELPPYRLVRYDPGGSAIDTTPIPAPGAGATGTWVYRGPEMATAMAIPLAPYTYVTVTPAGSILVGNSRDYLLAELRTLADTIRVVRHPWTPGRIPDSLKAAVVDEAALGYRKYGAEAAARRFMKVEDIPEFFPAFFGLHVDPCGRWWVRRTPQEAGGPTEFDVFSHEGHFLATTSVPVGLSQWGVGSRLLAGIAVDAAGTPGLVRFTLKWADGNVGDGEAGRCH